MSDKLTRYRAVYGPTSVEADNVKCKMRIAEQPWHVGFIEDDSLLQIADAWNSGTIRHRTLNRQSWPELAVLLDALVGGNEDEVRCFTCNTTTTGERLCDDCWRKEGNDE